MRKHDPIIKPKPFLKWAGGKKALLSEILKITPKNYNKYFEPFLGSGVLFFALQPKEAYLSDLNRELINAYKQLRCNVNRIVNILKKMKYDKESYYKIRSQKPTNNVSKAARFIYLNKTCWNGLYRENKKGKFNVPMGRYNNPTICDEKNLRLVSGALRKAIIKKADFEEMLKDASKSDLVYVDPPYTTSYKNNGFIEYNSKIFSLDDQKRLRDTVKKLDKKGCKIIMSNANHDFIRNLYKGFKFHVVKRKSLIAGNTRNRKTVTELIITNFKIQRGQYEQG